jgi:hypothetical protein
MRELRSVAVIRQQQRLPLLVKVRAETHEDGDSFGGHAARARCAGESVGRLQLCDRYGTDAREQLLEYVLLALWHEVLEADPRRVGRRASRGCAAQRAVGFTVDFQKGLVNA